MPHCHIECETKVFVCVKILHHVVVGRPWNWGLKVDTQHLLHAVLYLGRSLCKRRWLSLKLWGDSWLQQCRRERPCYLQWAQRKALDLWGLGLFRSCTPTFGARCPHHSRTVRCHFLHFSTGLPDTSYFAEPKACPRLSIVCRCTRH